jgi:hypothetical protein
MVQEAKLPRKIVEEESDVCEVDEGRCVCWGEIANLGRVTLKNRELVSDAFYESGSLPIVPMMQSAYHRLRFDDARIRVFDRSRLRTILPCASGGRSLVGQVSTVSANR